MGQVQLRSLNNNLLTVNNHGRLRSQAWFRRYHKTSSDAHHQVGRYHYVSAGGVDDGRPRHKFKANGKDHDVYVSLTAAEHSKLLRLSKISQKSFLCHSLVPTCIHLFRAGTAGLPHTFVDIHSDDGTVPGSSNLARINTSLNFSNMYPT
jgi:hypothetical protein